VNTFVIRVVNFCLIFKESQYEVQEAYPLEEPYMGILISII